MTNLQRQKARNELAMFTATKAQHVACKFPATIQNFLLALVKF